MRTIFLFSILAWWMTSCAPLKQVECSGVKGVELKRIDLTGVEGKLLLEIKNPNRYTFVIYPSDFDIVYSGISLGKAKLTKSVKVKGSAENVYGFELKKDFKDIALNDVLKLLNGGVFKNTIEVKGQLKVGRFLIKKKIPVDLKEKVRLN